jgi:GNAT superfamily N-acetyltransferase
MLYHQLMREMQVTQITGSPTLDFSFSNGFSFFKPYIKHHIQETLEVGGEAYIATNSEGGLLGVFIYDDFERRGAIFTKQRAVFDYFYRLKTFNFLFSELKTELENEVYDIYSLNLKGHVVSHRFSYEISPTKTDEIAGVERFMFQTHLGINGRWVRVALDNGERYFLVRLSNELAGIGWVSLVNGVGRLHSLYVRPQYRRLGIGEDILNARLLWLKANNAQSVFTEIARSNLASSNNITKAHLKPTGEVYQYYRKPECTNKENVLSS